MRNQIEYTVTKINWFFFFGILLMIDEHVFNVYEVINLFYKCFISSLKKFELTLTNVEKL